MSLILDALNRSRQDTGQVPGLASVHYDPDDTEQANSFKRAAPWLALAAALLVIAWMAFDTPAVNEPAPVVSTPAAQAPAAVDELSLGGAPIAPVATRSRTAAASPESINRPAAAVSPENPGVSRAAAMQAPASSGDSPVVPSAIVAETVETAAPASGTAAVADLYRQRPQVPANPEARTVATPADVPAAQPSVQSEQGDTAGSTSQEQQLDIEKLVAQAQDEVNNARLDEHDAPFIADLSQQTKNDIPTIYYRRHDYSGEPGRSTVLLNGKTVKTGGKVAQGITVKEILPDSVVLEHRGTQFRLRALNSWVNL